MATQKHKVKQNDEWDELDVATAAAQGWMLDEFWDMATGRMQFGIRCTENSLIPSDEQARVFIEALAKKGNKLAAKANAIVFRSRIGYNDSTKKRKKA